MRIKRFTSLDEYATIMSASPINAKPLKFVIMEFEEMELDAVKTITHYQHNFYELTLELRKGCAYWIDEYFTPIGERRISFVKPGQSQLVTEIDKKEGVFKGITLLFDHEIIPFIGLNPQMDDRLKLLNGSFKPTTNLSAEQAADFENLMLLIKKEASTPSEHTELILQNYINILFLKLLPLIEFKEAERLSYQVRITRQFNQILDTSIAFNYNVTRIADVLNISPIYLTECVKKVTLKTPLQLLVEKKVERAKLLLMKRDVSIAEVAYQLGFNDPNNFSTFFKKQVGKSPSSYVSEFTN